MDVCMYVCWAGGQKGNGGKGRICQSVFLQNCLTYVYKHKIKIKF